jgi:hypothetical protein
VLGLAAPDVHLEEGGVAVAPLAVLLDPLGDRDPQVGDGDAVVGEAELGVLDQVAGNAGAPQSGRAGPDYGTSSAVRD